MPEQVAENDLALAFSLGRWGKARKPGGRGLKLKASLRTPIPATVVQMLQSVYYTLSHLSYNASMEEMWVRNHF